MGSMRTPITKEAFKAMVPGEHAIVTPDGSIWRIVGTGRTALGDVAFVAELAGYGRLNIEWSTYFGQPNIIVEHDEIEVGLNQPTTKIQLVSEIKHTQRPKPSLPDDGGDYDNPQPGKDQPPELRGNPFIEKISCGDTPRECGYCLFREIDGKPALDCQVIGDSRPKDAFSVPRANIMPRQIDGLEVGNYCKAWCHFAAD